MPKSAKRKKLAELSSEEFFEHGFDSDVSSTEEEVHKEVLSKGKKITQKEARPNTLAKSKHKDQLSKLEDKDPEFYKFLKENDSELLEFDESEDGSDESSGDENTEESSKPSAASFAIMDETVEGSQEPVSEEELSERELTKEGETITLDLLKKLQKGLQKNSLFSLRRLMRIFHAAVSEASDFGEEERKTTSYKIESATVFNSIVQVCLKSVSGVLNHHLIKEKKSKPGKAPQLPSASSSWSKVKVTIKGYLKNLLQLLRQLAEPSMLAVILRHVHDLCLYYVCFPKVTKMLIKRLVRMWSSSEEHLRVLAFLSIRKISLLMPQLFDFILKQLYTSFVKSVKFYTPKTKPLIIFMQNSLVEMFSIDNSVTYQYGFIYIRQMAIHLRNALSNKKKESHQAVYNWQFISCVQLWSRVLGELNNDTLKPLIYPLVQVTLGVIRLIPTARFFPLRFHCIRALNDLSASTNSYIPLASYLVEILENQEFNKKTKPSTMAAPDFSCVLKVPKSLLHTRSFQDAVMDNICHLLLEHFVNHSKSIAFPELIFPVCLRMKRYMKKTEVAKFSKQIKQIVDKLQETGHEITKKRSSVNFSPKDITEVNDWESEHSKVKNSLQKFYDTWLKMRALAEGNAQHKREEQDDDDDDDKDEDDDDDDEDDDESYDDGDNESNDDDDNESDDQEKKKPMKKKRKLENETPIDKTVDSEKRKKRREEQLREIISDGKNEEKEDLVEDFQFSSSEED